MTMLEFDEKGLIPVIVQDMHTNEVLMHAYTNQEAFDLMLETGKTHFWSRSREELWMKGETSGNVQDIASIQTDCDQDTLLVRVDQTGHACHTGRHSCFAEILYGDIKDTAAIVPELMRVIKDRKENPVEGSYTCKLFKDEDKMLKKVIEEAGELAIAAKGDNPEEIAWETADLIYHLLVLLEGKDVPLEKVFEKLSERRK
ncbi:MAG: bifunctional phosphoribosyl-AMP cyclohydrolase/phosphoribosyl-ATP diphosphatase HisIE [Methanomassiliicoccales archaeon]|nr:bifunctional phosphoribosyl-AMP cyclohydrolase/phosphoribosyl-ATP diphosphatase HisIE [Methanomassiliicoccales archaeon]NYT14562.1 bifunctional phosphoribosyl-AMP cyclohydrolase/phosphoribosyl-ATP diphosphatase HisIE [Methanomassiliicoccales archaeon]